MVKNFLEPATLEVLKGAARRSGVVEAARRLGQLRRCVSRDLSNEPNLSWRAETERLTTAIVAVTLSSRELPSAYRMALVNLLGKRRTAGFRL